jgi:hypothetical protein
MTLNTKYISILIFYFFTLVTFGQVQKIKVKKLTPTPATFPKGKDSIAKYLNYHVLKTLNGRQNLPESIKFKAYLDINSKGEVSKVTLTQGSTFPDIDSLFIRSVRKMKWKPATNDKGVHCNDKQFLPYNIDFSDDFNYDF